MAITRCKKCGEPVKYINRARVGDEIHCCQPDPVEAVTESGRKMDVYLFHECNEDVVCKKSIKMLVGGGKLE